MSIDLNQERPISFNEAADLLSQLLGMRLTYKKVYTWSRFGFKKVVLEHVRIGQSLFTTREALGRFVRGILETSTEGRSFFHVEGIRGRAALASALNKFEAEGTS